MNILALDLSLTSTGIALTDGATDKVTTDAADRLEVRLERIVDGIGKALEYSRLADNHAADLIVVEDYVTASKFSGSVAPVHGAVRLWLWRSAYPVALVAPASLKLYATGKGNSNKDAMGIAAMKRAGVDFSGRPDECDAWWLRAMALDAHGEAMFDMPAAQRAAMEKVKWPDVRAEADR